MTRVEYVREQNSMQFKSRVSVELKMASEKNNKKLTTKIRECLNTNDKFKCCACVFMCEKRSLCLCSHIIIHSLARSAAEYQRSEYRSELNGINFGLICTCITYRMENKNELNSSIKRCCAMLFAAVPHNSSSKRQSIPFCDSRIKNIAFTLQVFVFFFFFFHFQMKNKNHHFSFVDDVFFVYNLYARTCKRVDEKEEKNWTKKSRTHSLWLE